METDTNTFTNINSNNLKGKISSFSGVFNWQNTANCLDLIEQQFIKFNFSLKTKKIARHIATELLDNICRHANQSVNSTYPSFFGCWKINNTIEFITKNIINTTEINTITQYLNEINRLTSEEINKQYLDQLKNGVIDETHRAGLGLLDIRRKTNEIIYFNYEEVTASTCYLSLRIIIPIE